MDTNIVVRGGGSIGARHAEVFRALGCEVSLWPVRARPEEPDVLDDTTGPDAAAAADLVVIATDTSRHVADAIAALDAGATKVLVEKPVAPTAQLAGSLVEHPRADAVWVAAPLRAHHAFRRVLEAMADLEPPLSAHIWCQSWLPDWRPGRDYRESYSARADEGGVLRDLVHELDYAAELFGPADLIGAALDTDGPLDMAAEQAATLLWRTAPPIGATVTCRLDYITLPATRGLIVRSSVGCIEWQVNQGRVIRVFEDGTPEVTDFPEDLDRNLTMATQARAALDLSPTSEPALRHRMGAPATLAQGLATLELCDRAREIS